MPSAAFTAATTSSAPAICGTRSPRTNETASTRGSRAATRRETSSARTTGASTSGSFWRPSRGPTSQIVTRTRPPPIGPPLRDALPGLGQHVAEDAGDLRRTPPAPATSGGEIWTTGSPRSSARQIRPRSKSSGERKPRSSVSRLLGASKRLAASPCPSRARAPRSSRRRAGRRRWRARAACASCARNASSCSATCSTIRSRCMISRFLSAIAQPTGWPPNVMPCE